MKLNKKVFSLALALGLGISGFVPSYAKKVEDKNENSHTVDQLISNDYKEAEKNFLKVVEKNKEIKAKIPQLKKDLLVKRKAYEKAIETENAKKFVRHIYKYIAFTSLSDFDNQAKAFDDDGNISPAVDLSNNPIVKEYRSLIKNEIDAAGILQEVANYLGFVEGYAIFKDQNKYESIKKEYENEGKDFNEVLITLGYLKNHAKAQEEGISYVKKIESMENNSESLKKELDEIKDKLAMSLAYDQSKEYLNAKKAFVEAGAKLLEIKKIEDSNISSKEDKKEDEKLLLLKEKYEENKVAIKALEMLKEFAPKTVAKNQAKYDSIMKKSKELQKKTEELLKR